MDLEQTVIYESLFLSVFTRTGDQGEVRCTYVRRYGSPETASAALQRLDPLNDLVHPSIITVEEIRLEEDRQVCVDSEWSRDDLENVIEQREWTQDECWNLLCYLTTALAAAQRLGIAHGSLQPASIWRTEEGLYKLADFQCPNSPCKGEELYERNEPFYLSPELRNAYARFLLGEEVAEIAYNPYKSDVYSLGLIIVSLLEPTSLTRFCNPTALQVAISTLQIHPDFQRVLLHLLEFESCNRPDWLELELFLQQMQENSQKEEEEVAINRIKLVRNAIDEEESASITQVIEQKMCLSCSQAFSLNKSEPWRLDFLGSAHSHSLTNYCSLPCFQRTHSQGPVPVPKENSVHVNVSATRQFYNCFRHMAILPKPALIVSPTVLAPCPECKAGEILLTVVEPLKIAVVRNSLYPTLLFVQQKIYSRNSRLSIRYFRSVTSSFLDVLQRSECHLCKAQLQPQAWICFFHSHRAELVCSSACLLQGLQGEVCPACAEPVGKLDAGEITQERAEKNVGRVVALSGDHCSLCLLSPGNWTLLCGCQFCLECLQIIPNYADMSEFSCPRCGVILQKDDNKELLDMLVKGDAGVQ